MTNVTSFILFYFPKVLSSCFRLYFVIRRYSLSEREIESDNPFFLPRSRTYCSPEPSRSLLGAEELFAHKKTELSMA